MIHKAMPFRVLAAIAVGALIAGCQEQRVEYRKVPSFFADASPGGRLPEPVTLADGTTIVYQERSFGSSPSRGNEFTKGRVFEPIVIKDDGSVELHAILPEHILNNIMYCLREEKYEQCWTQVLSETTRQAMAAQGDGKEEFVGFLQRNRKDIVGTCNRMLLGMPRQQVILEAERGGVIRMKFRPTIATDFHFRKVDLITEGFELKLLVIR